ncbi:MAG: DUF3429 domain-containing protein [Gammaproteobacteria bacterium]|jgi:hypothetical protein
MNSRLIINGLGYLGLLPFLAGAMLVLSGRSVYSLQPGFLFVSYSTVILSFLGGVLWGRSLSLGESPLRWALLLLSNGIALLAWFSLLGGTASYRSALLSLMLGYVVVFVAERGADASLETALTRPYRGFRLVLTSLVVLLHLVVVFADMTRSAA